MLTIRKFAELAGTTRRTLLFYDDQNVFKPTTVADNGYRYYSYDQLYQLKFILQLRKLGLSVNDIKTLTQNSPEADLTAELNTIFANIETEINNLTELKTTLTERYQQPNFTAVDQLHQPHVKERPALTFWCTPESVGCTDEAISALYRTFYETIGPLKLLDKHESGFLTALPDCDPAGYMTANFKILKAVSQTAPAPITTVTRPAGRYVTVTAANAVDSITAALAAMQATIRQQHLTITGELWVLNLDEILVSKAGSKYISLEYQLV